MQNFYQGIDYLSTGTLRQKAAYKILCQLNIFEYLKSYVPVLVGTIPLNIDIETSDLDIICEAKDLDLFEELVTKLYGNNQNFRKNRKIKNGILSSIVKFVCDGFAIEIFAQDRPAIAQTAYLHMLVEERLLAIAGETAREEIRRLKSIGIKTEPAFAQYFNLKGDPYEILENLSAVDISQLETLVKNIKPVSIPTLAW